MTESPGVLMLCMNVFLQSLRQGNSLIKEFGKGMYIGADTVVPPSNKG